MPILIPITLFGWIPVILIIFSALPPRRAVLVAFIGAWLFLPYAGYDLPGLPAYTKRSATSMGVALGTVLFRFDWLSKFKFRWFDIPMATWCLCPMASSIVNNLGFYDGLSAILDYFISYGLPYAIGRIYFTKIDHLREIAIGIAMGGLVYIPFCLFEFRISPQTHRLVYGFDPSGWGEVVYGGYRPKVFMSCGLELAVWMTAASTTGVWLWASGALKKLWGVPFGWVLLFLVATTVMCKVAGAWILLLMGVSLWPFLKISGSRLPAIGLMLVPILYLSTRATGLWSGDEAVELVRTTLNERRAQSLQFRIINENLLVDKALERPLFGWGGWGGARLHDASGRFTAFTDGMWVIALGNNGLVGLISLNAALLLPMMLLLRRCPLKVWQTSRMAPASVLAILVTLYSIDYLANAMLNPIYYLVLGGLTGVLGTLDRKSSLLLLSSDVQQLYRPKNHDRATGYFSANASGGQNFEIADPREAAASRLAALGRSLMEHGRTREAQESWHSALEHWAELVANHPDNVTYRDHWLDGQNDAAWSLVAYPGRDARYVSRAIQLASQAIEVEPDNAIFWNTLGIAYFRARDWNASMHALKSSTELSHGGTSFDYFFMAMASWEQGNVLDAKHYYGLAIDWMDLNSPDNEDLSRFREEAKHLLNHSLAPTNELA